MAQLSMPSPDTRSCGVSVLAEDVKLARKLDRRSRRGYQRIISGLSKSGEYRLLLLTSSPESPVSISASWRKFRERMRRRGALQDYIKVTEFTKSGLPHIHLLWRGTYVERKLIEYHWFQVHRAYFVRAKRLKARNGSYQRVASYLAKYLVKDQEGYLSSSRWWLRPGACHIWDRLKVAWHRYTGPEYEKLTLKIMISAFQWYLSTGQHPSFALRILGSEGFAAYAWVIVPYPTR